MYSCMRVCVCSNGDAAMAGKKEQKHEKATKSKSGKASGGAKARAIVFVDYNERNRQSFLERQKMSSVGSEAKAREI
eukprot:6193962-Pleurochrysis_carterae.AAC.1